MRKIYLRLIEIEASKQSEEIQLKNVKDTVEKITEFKWKEHPKFHFKGGYIILGEIPEAQDLEEFLIKLHHEGYTAVI